MNPIIYNIPAQLVEAYRGRKVIVRSDDAAELVRRISPEDIEHVEYVQLLSLAGDVDVLTQWGESIPVDIIMRDPANEFTLLYNFSKVLDKHPARVSISVRPGFIKAVKLALALQFSVKLELDQPGPDLIEELKKVLELYLHRTSVSQPVEYFHSIFLSFYHPEPTSLWFIQEEDPEQYRFVTDEGIESVSPRFTGGDPKIDIDDFIREQRHVSHEVGSECDDCEFLSVCGGYFKWPDKDFSCEGVKVLFTGLKEAAKDLQNDLEAFAVAQAGGQQQ